MKVTNRKPFAVQNVVPFRKRLGLMGLGDDTVDSSGYASGAAPQDVYNSILANTGDANLAASATGNYASQIAAMQNAGVPAYSASNPGANLNGPAIDATTANLIANLAKIGAGAYVASGQTQVGIAPPGYTYRGYATNITSGYGNLAPPGYSNAGLYSNGYPYSSGTPYAQITPTTTTGAISTNTLLLMAGLAAVVMIANKDGKKK